MPLPLTLPPDLFLGVEPLLLEAEALDLVEVGAGLEGHHVVGGDAVDGPVGRVGGRVEGQSCLPGTHLGGGGQEYCGGQGCHVASGSRTA